MNLFYDRGNTVKKLKTALKNDIEACILKKEN